MSSGHLRHLNTWHLLGMYLFPTCQPACPEVKKKYKKKYCIVYICSLYMIDHAPMMFTCMRVLSCLVVKGGCTCEIWIVGTKNKLLGGPRQTRWTQDRSELVKSNPRTRPRFTYSRGPARDSRSGMYKMYIQIMMLWFVRKEERKTYAVYCPYDWFVYFSAG